MNKTIEVDLIDKDVILEGLKRHSNNVSALAAELGVDRRRLSSKVQRMGVSRGSTKSDKKEDKDDTKLYRSRQIARDRARTEAAINRQLSRELHYQESIGDKIVRHIKERGIRTVVPSAPLPSQSGQRGVTIELLFSDLQMGKLGDDYNSEVAKKRIATYCSAISQEIIRYSTKYRIDKIVVSFLGDLIESDEKHLNSGRACDTSTAEQMADALLSIWYDFLTPLCVFQVPIDVVCVTGNHDHNGNGLNMFKPGLNHLSYPIYKGLEALAKASGIDHMKFIIPEGSFITYDIYDNTYLYEHGVGVSATEAALTTRLRSRSEQCRKFIHGMRMGDKHSLSRFKNDLLIVNGAFFGTGSKGTEYSGIMGFCNEPAQLLLVHTPRDDNRSTIYSSMTIQLGHVV